MPAKCDAELGWWITLANLHKRELPQVIDLNSASKGFADKVRKLTGPLPEEVAIVLGAHPPLRHALIVVGNEPDQSTWGLAGVTNALLSELASARDARKLPRDVVIADWSGFVAPLILSISASGVIESAQRSEPLAKLLDLLRHKTIAIIGSCPVCGMLFERLRRDQTCDTTRCRDIHRQRRNRKTHQENMRAKKPLS